MLITRKTAIKVRKKRAVEQLGKVELAQKLSMTSRTLTKVENGDYDAPRRIYKSVMEWLTEDV